MNYIRAEKGAYPMTLSIYDTAKNRVQIKHDEKNGAYSVSVFYTGRDDTNSHMIIHTEFSNFSRLESMKLSDMIYAGELEPLMSVLGNVKLVNAPAKERANIAWFNRKIEQDWIDALKK
jgi:hypothetical protein